MKPATVSEQFLDAIFSSKVWASIIFIVFGVSLVVYIFSVVTGSSLLLLIQS